MSIRFDQLMLRRVKTGKTRRIFIKINIIFKRSVLKGTFLQILIIKLNSAIELRSLQQTSITYIRNSLQYVTISPGDHSKRSRHKEPTHVPAT